MSEQAAAAKTAVHISRVVVIKRLSRNCPGNLRVCENFASRLLIVKRSHRANKCLPRNCREEADRREPGQSTELSIYQFGSPGAR